MVRVVSQNFSPPRSRHSSGDTDRDLAERANLALSVNGRRRFETSEYESSSDSFWDSEFDGDQCEAVMSESGSMNDINGNETPEKSDVQSKRKERRRERNKLSAQAYRQRRRTQSVKEQQTLMELEAENKRLHRLVETLEKKTENAKQHLLRCCPLPRSEVLQPIGEMDGATADMPDTDPDLIVPQAADPIISQMFASHSRDVPVSFPLHSHPSPTLPPPNLVNKFAHTSSTNASRQPVPILAKSKAEKMTYPTPIQTSAAVCPTLPPSQFIFNANVLIGATLSGVTNLTAVPAILTVPIENPTSNLNCNPLRTCPPGTKSTTNPSAYLENETNHTKPAGDSSAVFNTVWWNGNQLKPNGNPVTGTLVSLVSMEFYNKNSMNGNSISGNDSNGNSRDDKSVSQQSHPGTQPMSFNLNLNQAAGTTRQEILCQEQFQNQHPVIPVQCFLASDDQVSVQ